MNRFHYLLLLSLFWGAACEQPDYGLFREVPARESGITFNNTLREEPALNILNYLYYYNGGGVAIADINQDSLPDIYLTSNQGPDALYLNLGGLRFREISKAAGIVNEGGWTTGVTHADVNADGLLDFYVSKVGSFGSHNLLFVNQGNNARGIPQFKEVSAEYGLDLKTYSTQAAFFDYDLDGDLDLFQLNHSRHPNRTYGRGGQRQQRDELAGDRLFENRNGKYYEVSEQAGIFQGRIGYGLGLGISDLDGNGFPDIYVGNDFFENDYLYLNQGDGSFRDLVSNEPDRLGHTSHYSMGNELADLDNDGHPDILSLDMLPEDLETYKTSGTEYPYPTYAYYLKNGYAPQYMQNTLHRNLGNGNFSEIAYLAGVAATEWSWAPLAADFDNDGDKDLFITNGIKGATNDMDFINFIANEAIQERLSAGMQEKDMDFIARMPSKKTRNYFFRNQGNMEFEKAGSEWAEPRPTYSNGAAYADLDLDGDLDLVVNNVDAPATLLENRSEPTGSSYLRVAFRGPPQNPFGIGARVSLYSGGEVQFQENYPTRGYLSAVPPTLHFGTSGAPIDSVRVVWPGGATQILRPESQTILLDFNQAKAGSDIRNPARKQETWIANTPVEIDYRHQERSSLDFNRSPLAPFAYSNQGPGVTAGDLNKDGIEELVLTGAKGQATRVYAVDEKTGSGRMIRSFDEHALNEDTDALILDVDKDGLKDLVVVSGGNEALTGPALQARLYRNNGNSLEFDPGAFEGISLNASSVTTTDLENDGDADLLITADATDTEFGKTPEHYLLINDGKGNFSQAPESFTSPLSSIGQVTQARWRDLDGNGFEDLVVVGHWMPVMVFYNDGTQLRRAATPGLQNSEGWWNSLVITDLNKDGRADLVAGNWGLNTRLRASKERPVTLYRYDFDQNSTVDPLVTYFHDGKETPFASKDELVKQMPLLNKKFLSYKEFAQASLDELFGMEKLAAAEKKSVYELESCVFLQDPNGDFRKIALPREAQSASIYAIVAEDLDADGYPDLLLAGNTYEISTQLGRIDASHGLFLRSNQDGTFRWSPQARLDISGAARDVEKFRIGNDSLYVFTINDGKPVFLSTNQKE